MYWHEQEKTHNAWRGVGYIGDWLGLIKVPRVPWVNILSFILQNYLGNIKAEGSTAYNKALEKAFDLLSHDAPSNLYLRRWYSAECVMLLQTNLSSDCPLQHYSNLR